MIFRTWFSGNRTAGRALQRKIRIWRLPSRLSPTHGPVLERASPYIGHLSPAYLRKSQLWEAHERVSPLTLRRRSRRLYLLNRSTHIQGHRSQDRREASPPQTKYSFFFHDAGYCVQDACVVASSLRWESGVGLGADVAQRTLKP